MPTIKEEPKTVQVTVARGKSVMHQVMVGSVLMTKTSGPGEVIELSLADAAHAREYGFLHNDDDAEVIIRTPMRPAENQGKIGLQSTQEPTSSEGMRPGYVPG